MAALPETYNLADIPPDTGWGPVPDGDYRVAITDSDVKPTKTGNGTLAVFTLEIIEGEYSGRKIFENLCIVHESAQTQAIARGKLSAIGQATGVTGNASDTNQFHDKPFIVTLGIDPAKDGQPARNKIMKYHAASGSSNSTPSQQPAQQQQKTANASPGSGGKRPWEKN